MSAQRSGPDARAGSSAESAEDEDECLHARVVDAWIAETGAIRLRPAARDGLFEAALAAVWGRAKLTLGPRTLTAIGERVAHAASRKEPLLAGVAVDDSGFDFSLVAEVAEAAKDKPDGEATAALRTLLLELVVMLGHFTAEILTPALHEQIARVKTGQRQTERR